jgi:hypothetical protein
MLSRPTGKSGVLWRSTPAHWPFWRTIAEALRLPANRIYKWLTVPASKPTTSSIWLGIVCPTSRLKILSTSEYSLEYQMSEEMAAQRLRYRPFWFSYISYVDHLFLFLLSVAFSQFLGVIISRSFSEILKRWLLLQKTRCRLRRLKICLYSMRSKWQMTRIQIVQMRKNWL